MLKPSTTMSALSPQPPVVLDRSLATIASLFRQEVRPGNPQRDFWESWAHRIDMYGFSCPSEKYQHDQCWSWPILRTSYDDDQQFNQAVTAIQRLALVRLEDEHRDSRSHGKPNDDALEAAREKICEVRHSAELISQAWSTMVEHAQNSKPGETLTPDDVISHELVRRYHMDIVENNQTLDGADVPTAWGHARSLDPEQKLGSRSGLFIYLDQESIRRLAQAPSQEELANMAPEDRSKTAWDFWVKAVWTESETDEDHEDTGQMADIPLGRRRVRLYDMFDVFMDLSDGSLDEMQIEGTDRQRFDRQRLSWPGKEWELCQPSETNYSIRRNTWLQELYGGMVYR